MKASIVVGLGFGDEGKGLVTASLVTNSKNPLVIRFNGGHQAGHTVVKDGFRHVFSSFGSGTLHSAPSYWSPFCTVYPTALLNEFEIIKRFNPKLYIDPLCPITTPFDVISNQITAKHGSVGVGFGETLRRQENHFTLYAKDLKYRDVLDFKMDQIKQYYNIIGYGDKRQDFIRDVTSMLSLKNNIFIEQPSMERDLIFEGAQGILLDQRFGFFPHVTRSNTTSQNALTLLPAGIETEIYMVTRAYQTRHGAGPMTNEHLPVILRNNEKETNKSHKFQGEFRVAPLDQQLLNYALECEELVSKGISKKIVMTCIDQVNQKPNFKSKYHIFYNSDPQGNWNL